jgi:hypothetical protein
MEPKREEPPMLKDIRTRISKGERSLKVHARLFYSIFEGGTHEKTIHNSQTWLIKNELKADSSGHPEYILIYKIGLWNLNAKQRN